MTTTIAHGCFRPPFRVGRDGRRRRRRREGVAAAVVWRHGAGVGQIALHRHPIVSRVWRRGARGATGRAAGRGGSTIAGRNTGISDRNEAAEGAAAAAATSPRLPTRGPTLPSRYCVRRPRDDSRTGMRASGIPRLLARKRHGHGKHNEGGVMIPGGGGTRSAARGEMAGRVMAT